MTRVGQAMTTRDDLVPSERLPLKLSEIFARLGDTTPVFEGNGWVAICPAHPDHEPSLRVAMTEGDRLIIKCRAGCQWQDVLTAAGFSSFAEMEPIEDDMDRSATHVNDMGEPVTGADQATMANYLQATQGYDWTNRPEAPEYALRRFGINLQLFKRNFDGSPVGPFNLYAINPLALMVDGQVTWNDYASGQPWSTSGGDFDARLSEHVRIRGGSGQQCPESTRQLRLGLGR